MLIVIVVLGLLVLFALPRLTSTKERAVLSSMQAGLRNLATAQEGHYNTNRIYSIDPMALNVSLSSGNLLTINEATAGGWSATITNPVTSSSCYLFHGVALPVGTASTEGDISCS